MELYAQNHLKSRHIFTVRVWSLNRANVTILLILRRRCPSSNWNWDDAISHLPPPYLPPSFFFSLCLPFANKQCCLLHAWGIAISSLPSVRQIAGEMDVSVSQRCLISVRCSVYFRLFRGLLAGKPHIACLKFVWGKQNWANSSALSSSCSRGCFFFFFLAGAFSDVGLHVNLQFSAQKKKASMTQVLLVAFGWNFSSSFSPEM